MHRGRERISTPIKNWLNPVSGTTPEPEPAGSYVRPTDWIDMPTISAGTEKVCILTAVYDSSSNPCAILVAGDYTVDWGDGSAPENFSSGVTAEHIMDYSGLSAETECTRGYRQAIIEITPQAGSNLTAINLARRHSISSSMYYISQYLDVLISASNCTTLVFYTANVCNSRMLEQVIVNEIGTITNFTSMFQTCGFLQSLTLDTSSGTNFTSMFAGCGQLKYMPDLDLSNATTLYQTFNGCAALEEIPLLDTSKVTNLQQTFNNCASLREIPLLDTSKVTTFYGTFQQCRALSTVALLDMSSALTVQLMFDSCYSLITTPAFNTSKCTNFSLMFDDCWSLKTVGLLDTSSGTTFHSMFTLCKSLEEIPLIDTSKGKNFGYMFAQAHSLARIPALNVSSGTIFDYMFYLAVGLKYVPDLNTSSATQMTWMFRTCRALKYIGSINGINSPTMNATFFDCLQLQSVVIHNAKITFSVGGCLLAREDLVDIFNELETVVGQTLTVTGNWGVATLSDVDKAIATDKGWTLVL